MHLPHLFFLFPRGVFLRLRLSEKEGEYHLKVKGEEQANELLGTLIAQKIPIITFDLREPSLHEIFVEKVGEANEAE